MPYCCRQNKNPEELDKNFGTFWIKLNMKHCCATPSQHQVFTIYFGY